MLRPLWLCDLHARPACYEFLRTHGREEIMSAAEDVTGSGRSARVPSSPRAYLIESGYRRSGFMAARRKNDQKEAQALPPSPPPVKLSPRAQMDSHRPDARTVREWVREASDSSSSDDRVVVSLTQLHQAKMAAALHTDFVVSGLMPGASPPSSPSGSPTVTHP